MADRVIKPQFVQVVAAAAGGPIVLAVAVVATALGLLFGSLFGGPDLSGVQKAIMQMRDTFTRAIDTTIRFAWSASRLALTGLLSILRIIQDGLKEIVKQLRRLAAAVKNITDHIITPILRALRHLRSILNDIYKNWLRPILNVIQKVRRILAIFRAFGFKWAGALDARLARIEGKIIAPYIWLVRQMNGYGSWINVILTAGGVFQKPVFRNTAYGNAGWLTNLWWTSQSGGLQVSSAVTPYTPAPVVTLPVVQAQMQQYARTNTGPLADAAARALSAATQADIGV